ncbi:sporulation histidine kinase inhibitor Sda [Paenibacillus sp.]|uniref:sporulation histidine kinase inhibitor Sda n=1 Tax=Paenibacillus sp. TaxID=58172 RepID=UPI002810D6E5|nr:sporulation histidine kinase inhibitor Sda [Paenibacillus sp.]
MGTGEGTPYAAEEPCLTRQLSDEHLIDLYLTAKKLELEKEFLMMIVEELKRRGIEPKELE